MKRIYKKCRQIKMLIRICVVLLVFCGAGLQFTACSNKNADSKDTTTTYTEKQTATAKKGVSFRNSNLLNQHYQKHGVKMGFSSAAEYEAAARSVVENSNSLHKIEAEDGDDVYYLESTNEFVIVSTDGYIRTYFKPDTGIDYFNRQ